MSGKEWRVALCGINHKSSTLKQRESLQLNPEEIPQAIQTFVSLDGVVEVSIISTCNRIEFYFVGAASYEPWDVLREFYLQFRQQDISGLAECFYTVKGKHVAEHLFRVCAGIDSMVLGENQIFGQVKEAYGASCQAHTTGKIQHRLFHQAFRVGKQVRTKTELGKGACSVSSAATELLKENLDKSERPTVMFIGVNRMTTLAASYWKKLHHNRLLFVNRTVEKAAKLAAGFKSNGYSLSEMPDLLGQTDILFTCTGSDRPIVSREMIRQFVIEHPDRKLQIMDIAIPRDVDIEKDFHPNVTVYDLDDVKAFVASRQERRKRAVVDAEAIIAERLKEFAYWYDHVRQDFVYNGLTETFEAIKDRELAPILELLPSEYRKAVQEAAERMATRMAQVKIRDSGGSSQKKKGQK